MEPNLEIQMNKKELLQENESTTRGLMQRLAAFTPEQHNEHPVTGGWTAGQVAEHLVKASVVEVLYGPVKPSQRPPDQQVQPLKDLFLNFSIKMTSPDFIQPAEATYDRDSQLQKLEKIGTRVGEAIQTLDLSATCLWTPAPLGELTRLELISFYLAHTQRHLYQLEKIYRQLTAVKSNGVVN